MNILSAVDDIQVMMDDHILKAQTMRGSPYVKAFEAVMQEWEEKLISMQDILEQWLLVGGSAVSMNDHRDKIHAVFSANPLGCIWSPYLALKTS